ncbi:hypothetical protein LXL04_019161 [Taraxacum kok-saghyz]
MLDIIFTKTSVSLHHYKVDVFVGVIDMQPQELNNRFTEGNTKLVISMALLCPGNSFQAFNVEELLKMAKCYPNEFPEHEFGALRANLQNYIIDVRGDAMFKNFKGIGNLAKMMVKTNKHIIYPKVYLLLKLALILPVATATVERSFSAMKLIKNDLRNKMSDQFMNDCLVSYIKKDRLDCISNNSKKLILTTPTSPIEPSLQGYSMSGHILTHSAAENHGGAVDRTYDLSDIRATSSKFQRSSLVRLCRSLPSSKIQPCAVVPSVDLFPPPFCLPSSVDLFPPPKSSLVLLCSCADLVPPQPHNQASFVLESLKVGIMLKFLTKRTYDPSSSNGHEKSHKDIDQDIRTSKYVKIDLNTLPADPGERPSMDKYHVNQ